MNKESNNINFNTLANNVKNNNEQLFSNTNVVSNTPNSNVIPNNYNAINDNINTNIVQKVNTMPNTSIVNNNTNISITSSSNMMPNNQTIFIDRKDNIFDNPQKNNNKNKIISILFGKKAFLILAILTFIFTSITVGKTFYLRSIVEQYGDLPVEIDEKESSEIILNVENNFEAEKHQNIAASELVNCINSSIDVKNLPESVSSIIQEIKDYYNKSNNHFAFKYKDIYTGFSISYNENQHIYAASTIKAPTDIYVYEMASLDKIDLNEKIKYTSSHYVYGSGIIKNSELNTMYDVKTLLKYSTVISDNVAHNMLMDRFGRTNMLEFWKNLGTTAIFQANSNWGGVNAHDAAIYMEELYRFYSENDTYGQELMNNFMNATPKFIKGKNNYKVANKSGWGASSIHDISIIFADNPYILVALSNLGQTDYYMSYFNTVNDLTYRLHTAYWKYKMDLCNNINQY